MKKVTKIVLGIRVGSRPPPQRYEISDVGVSEAAAELLVDDAIERGFNAHAVLDTHTEDLFEE